MAEPVLYRAKTSFVVAAPEGGQKRRINEGDFVTADDPALPGREALFETAEAFMARTHPEVHPVAPTRRPRKPTAKAVRGRGN